MLVLSIVSPVSDSMLQKTSTREIITLQIDSLFYISTKAFWVSIESFSAQMKSAPCLSSQRESLIIDWFWLWRPLEIWSRNLGTNWCTKLLSWTNRKSWLPPNLVLHFSISNIINIINCNLLIDKFRLLFFNKSLHSDLLILRCEGRPKLPFLKIKSLWKTGLIG